MRASTAVRGATLAAQPARGAGRRGGIEAVARASPGQRPVASGDGALRPRRHLQCHCLPTIWITGHWPSPATGARPAHRQLPLHTTPSPTHNTHPQAPTDLAAWKQQLKGARADVAELIRTTSANPILVRLAWHDSGTYDKGVPEPWPKPGGATASIRFKPEISHGANAGARARKGGRTRSQSLGSGAARRRLGLSWRARPRLVAPAAGGRCQPAPDEGSPLPTRPALAALAPTDAQACRALLT